jgi:hypothetical protein
MVDGFTLRNVSPPDTARQYRQLMEIRPRENESPDATIDRVSKARAAIIATAQDSEISSDILLGAFLLNLISINNKDMVNLVYSTQGEKPLTFKEASASITRLIGARMEDPEIDPKALAARPGNNKIKKRQNKKRSKRKKPRAQ